MLVASQRPTAEGSDKLPRDYGWRTRRAAAGAVAAAVGGGRAVGRCAHRYSLPCLPVRPCCLQGWVKYHREGPAVGQRNTRSCSARHAHAMHGKGITRSELTPTGLGAGEGLFLGPAGPPCWVSWWRGGSDLVWMRMEVAGSEAGSRMVCGDIS